MQAKPRLEWRPQASADLVEIVAYIADDNPDAAQELKDEIEAKVDKLPHHPGLYKPSLRVKDKVPLFAIYKILLHRN